VVFVISALVFALIMTAMAVGVLAGREPIKGSCGGMGALGFGNGCEICGGDASRCETRSGDTADGADHSLYYPADTDPGRRG